MSDGRERAGRPDEPLERLLADLERGEELAAEAALLEVPDEERVPLKPASSFSVIGTSVPRNDVLEKSTGRAVFGIDAGPPEARGRGSAAGIAAAAVVIAIIRFRGGNSTDHGSFISGCMSHRKVSCFSGAVADGTGLNTAGSRDITAVIIDCGAVLFHMSF